MGMQKGVRFASRLKFIVCSKYWEAHKFQLLRRGSDSCGIYRSSNSKSLRKNNEAVCNFVVV